MSIFDFLKKIFEDNSSDEFLKEKVKLSEIENWVEGKIEENKVRDREAVLKINDAIKSFEARINLKLEGLEKFDVGLKKVDERLKTAVEEGRSKYLGFVKVFISNLNNLKEDGLEMTIHEINLVFERFNKSSYKSSEKASILIGKEMGKIRKEIKDFSLDVMKVFEENKKFVEKSKSLIGIKEKLKQKKEIELESIRVKNSLSLLDENINMNESKKKKFVEEINEVEKSPEYFDYLEKVEKVNILKKEIEKDFVELKGLIDFKALSNFYHIFGDKMKIVKKYNDKFRVNYEEDDGKMIIKLVEGAGLNSLDILKKVEEINKNKSEIQRFENELGSDRIDELSSEIGKLVLEINKLKDKKEKESKKLNQVNYDLKVIVDEIKSELGGIGVEVFN